MDEADPIKDIVPAFHKRVPSQEMKNFEDDAREKIAALRKLFFNQLHVTRQLMNKSLLAPKAYVPDKTVVEVPKKAVIPKASLALKLGGLAGTASKSEEIEVSKTDIDNVSKQPQIMSSRTVKEKKKERLEQERLEQERMEREEAERQRLKDEEIAKFNEEKERIIAEKVAARELELQKEREAYLKQKQEEKARLLKSEEEAHAKLERL